MKKRNILAVCFSVLLISCTANEQRETSNIQTPPTDSSLGEVQAKVEECRTDKATYLKALKQSQTTLADSELVKIQVETYLARKEACKIEAMNLLMGLDGGVKDTDYRYTLYKGIIEGL